MAAGSGAELETGAAGREPGALGRRRGELVRFKSKSYFDTLFMVHFEVIQTYFVPLFLCTEGRGRMEGRNGDGRTEGRRAAGGLAGGDTPHSMIYVGTIRGFGMQKFFFEFWGTGFG